MNKLLKTAGLALGLIASAASSVGINSTINPTDVNPKVKLEQKVASQIKKSLPMRNPTLGDYRTVLENIKRNFIFGRHRFNMKVFSSYDIEDLQKTGADPRVYAELAKAEYKPGKYYFEPDDIDDAAMVRAEVEVEGVFLPVRTPIQTPRLQTAESVRELIDFYRNQGGSKQKILSAIRSGLKKNDLVDPIDTEKPNALLTIPTGDHNGAFCLHEEYMSLIKELKMNYDLQLVIADSEGDVYRALRNGPKRDFIALSGHGDGQSLRLGYRRMRERSTLDVGDPELVDLLREKTNPDARIVLVSCSAAKDADKGKGLAKFIENGVNYKRPLQNTKVIAPTEDAHIDDVMLWNTDKPVSFSNTETGDVTYVTPDNTYDKVRTGLYIAGEIGEMFLLLPTVPIGQMLLGSIGVAGATSYIRRRRRSSPPKSAYSVVTGK